MSTESLQISRSEVTELRNTLQGLEIELQSQLSMVSEHTHTHTIQKMQLSWFKTRLYTQSLPFFTFLCEEIRPGMHTGGHQRAVQHDAPGTPSDSVKPGGATDVPARTNRATEPGLQNAAGH